MMHKIIHEETCYSTGFSKRTQLQIRDLRDPASRTQRQIHFGDRKKSLSMVIQCNLFRHHILYVKKLNKEHVLKVTIQIHTGQGKN
jgi:hypothetical protein